MHWPPQPSDSPQRRPAHERVQPQCRGEPPHVSPDTVHIVPGVQVPPQPSAGASPQARVEGGVHVGAQQVVPVQRSPLGHMVPFGHIGHVAGSIGFVPQASVVGSAHPGQQTPLEQVLPVAHI